MKASTITSTWSLNTPSIPIRSTGRSVVLELHVPGERRPLEAVEQRDQAAVPVGVVEVDGVDAGVGEVGGAPLGSVAMWAHPSRVDQLDGGSTARSEASSSTLGWHSHSRSSSSGRVPTDVGDHGCTDARLSLRSSDRW